MKQNVHEDARENITKIIDEMKIYMKEEIVLNSNLAYLAPRCKNRHAECASWANHGECEANPTYMLINCAPVCKTCHMLDLKTRCPIPPDAVDALKPGDLNKMFERIVNDESYDVTVISRPDYLPGDDITNSDYKIGPWVITIDNFIKNEECERLIELGGLEGYERSEDVGKLKFDGTYDSKKSTTRTSFNAWCLDKCMEDRMAKDVAARIEKLTGIPQTNSENFQLLRYETGQFYRPQ